ncbi:sulfur carrier protein ThiS [Aurantivibrio infirmus]
MINVSLNNKTINLPDSQLVSAIKASDIGEQKFAVAVNGNFIPRAEYAKVQLNNGDQIDIVSPVGGG